MHHCYLQSDYVCKGPAGWLSVTDCCNTKKWMIPSTNREKRLKIPGVRGGRVCRYHHQVWSATGFLERQEPASNELTTLSVRRLWKLLAGTLHWADFSSISPWVSGFVLNEARKIHGAENPWVKSSIGEPAMKWNDFSLGYDDMICHPVDPVDPPSFYQSWKVGQTTNHTKHCELRSENEEYLEVNRCSVWLQVRAQIWNDFAAATHRNLLPFCTLATYLLVIWSGIFCCKRTKKSLRKVIGVCGSLWKMLSAFCCGGWFVRHCFTTPLHLQLVKNKYQNFHVGVPPGRGRYDHTCNGYCSIVKALYQSGGSLRSSRVTS